MVMFVESHESIAEIYPFYADDIAPCTWELGMDLIFTVVKLFSG